MKAKGAFAFLVGLGIVLISINVLWFGNRLPLPYRVTFKNQTADIVKAVSVGRNGRQLELGDVAPSSAQSKSIIVGGAGSEFVIRAETPSGSKQWECGYGPDPWWRRQSLDLALASSSSGVFNLTFRKPQSYPVEFMPCGIVARLQQ